MTTRSSNTAARPSDAYPDCPDCETNVLVDGVDYAKAQYYCHGCETEFKAPGGYTPPEYEGQA
jgi:transposase-like protein